VDEGLNRSDIRSDPSDGSVSAGTTLGLGLRVLRIGGDGSCTPLPGAVVDLPGWYRGRTAHFHIKIQTTGTDGNPYEFTAQLYFTEESTRLLNSRVRGVGHAGPRCRTRGFGGRTRGSVALDTRGSRVVGRLVWGLGGGRSLLWR
jgi:protocatechuate 3,4-dioxygenase beta subunit